jgi:hypothetical protein
MFSLLWMISSLSHCMQWSSIQECSAILDTFIHCFLHLCSVIQVWNAIPVSPAHFLLHSYRMLYMQFFDSYVSFLGLVFVSMLHSIVPDLNAVHTPNFFLIL